MKCIHCGKAATFLDLCHDRHPVCDRHLGLGHQSEKAPAPTPTKPIKRQEEPE
jgi:hypothetical protein